MTAIQGSGLALAVLGHAERPGCVAPLRKPPKFLYLLWLSLAPPWARWPGEPQRAPALSCSRCCRSEDRSPAALCPALRVAGQDPGQAPSLLTPGQSAQSGVILTGSNHWTPVKAKRAPQGRQEGDFQNTAGGGEDLFASVCLPLDTEAHWPRPGTTDCWRGSHGHDRAVRNMNSRQSTHAVT